MNIVGQAKLLSTIDMYYNAKHLPKTLMFVGTSGCGKRTIAKYIADKFNLKYIDIDENISTLDLDDYLHSTIKTLYVINLSKFTEKQQNQFLKFIEEPSETVYVILTAVSEAGVLDTIINRCIKHNFEQYSKDQIEQITNASISDVAFNIFKSPGKLLNLTDASLSSTINLASHLVNNISATAYANIMTTITKLNYKDLYDKIDCELFLDAVEYLALECHKNNTNDNGFTIYKITNQFKQNLLRQNILKENLIVSYITTLWEAVNDIN